MVTVLLRPQHNFLIDSSTHESTQQWQLKLANCLLQCQETQWRHMTIPYHRYQSMKIQQSVLLRQTKLQRRHHRYEMCVWMRQRGYWKFLIYSPLLLCDNSCQSGQSLLRMFYPPSLTERLAKFVLVAQGSCVSTIVLILVVLGHLHGARYVSCRPTKLCPFSGHKSGLANFSPIRICANWVLSILWVTQATYAPPPLVMMEEFASLW